MKRKRDIQGKFTLKNDDYRQVRSLRLTETTWTALGITAESLGLTRADLLENLVRQNQGIFPYSGDIEKLSPEKNSLHLERSALKAQIFLNSDKLSFFAEIVLKELRLGKQASNYKLVQKSLKRLIELILSFSK